MSDSDPPPTLAPVAAAITELRLLECFVALAEEQHVGRAAQRLGMGQSTLSRSVQQLERRLGVELLSRGAGDVRLTPTGEAMLARSVELLDRHAAVAQEIRRLGRQHPTSLTVAVDGGFAGLLLAAAMREYRQVAPDAEITLRSSQYGAAAGQLLADGSADFALVGVEPLDPGTRSVTVGSCRRCAVLALGHPLADCDFVSLEELRSEPELRAGGASAQWKAQWSIAGLLAEDASIRGTEFSLFVDALDLVAAGQGILLAPDTAQRRFARADLCWVPVIELDAVPVHLAWRARNVSRSRAEALAAAFAEATGGFGATASPTELQGECENVGWSES